MSVAIIQPSRAIRIPANGIEIPYPANILGSAANLLTAFSLQTFAFNWLLSGIKVGDIVYNISSPASPTSATIIAIDYSSQTANLSSAIFSAPGQAFIIYQSYANSGVLQTPILYIGGFGGVVVETESSELVFFGSINTGSFLPVKIRRVLASGAGGTTTATNLIAVF